MFASGLHNCDRERRRLIVFNLDHWTSSAWALQHEPFRESFFHVKTQLSFILILVENESESEIRLEFSSALNFARESRRMEMKWNQSHDAYEVCLLVVNPFDSIRFFHLCNINDFFSQ